MKLYHVPAALVLAMTLSRPAASYASRVMSVADNSGDPFGLVCVPSGSDRLVCTNVSRSDLWTIRRFLGGAAGQHAFDQLSTLSAFQNWGGADCTGGPGSFSEGQCEQIAEVHARLTLHTDALCSSLGVRATRRFQRGQYRFHQGILGTNSRGDIIGRAYPRVLFWGGTTVLSSEIFGTAQYASSRQFLVAHEETHHLLISEGILNGIFGEGPANAAGTRCS